MNKLKNLLAEEKWKEADSETANIIFEIANRSGTQGYLGDEEWKVFPCQVLEAIDQLWTDYSKGHFGFSVQKAIYERLGVTKEYDQVTWHRFGAALGWYENRQFMPYQCKRTVSAQRRIVYSLIEPRGCLPVLGRVIETGARDDWGDISKYYGWDSVISSEWYSEVSGWHTRYEEMSAVHRRFSSFVSKLESCDIDICSSSRS